MSIKLISKFLLLLLVLNLSGSLMAQDDLVVMTINNQDIPRSEFEYIYNKNSKLNGSHQISVDDYLESFICFKLKVGEARSLGMDTLRTFRDELRQYRKLLAKSYLTDKQVEDEFTAQYYEHLRERNPYGQMKVLHVFKYLPQHIDKTLIGQAEEEMDSIYSLLKNNPNVTFEDAVNQYSDDKEPFWISFLQTPSEFENEVYALKEGEYSKPFYSPVGIHIVKLLEVKPLPSYDKVRNEISVRYARIHGITKGTLSKVEQLKKTRKFEQNDTAVALLLGRSVPKDYLFSYAGKQYEYSQFARFASFVQADVRQQFDFFVIKSVLDYENAHLEEFYPEFKRLMMEYEEGMLLYEISNAQVWKKAGSDTLGLKIFFTTHKDDYKWNHPKYLGMVMHGSTKKVLKRARRLIKDLPMETWQDTIDQVFNVDSLLVIKVVSGLFEPGDNASVDCHVFKQKKKDELMKGLPYTMLYGKKCNYPLNYKELGGRLVSDYQNFLDKLWTERLRRENKVEINYKVLKSVNNH